MSLTERLLSKSTIKLSNVLDKSKLLIDTVAIPTKIPVLNVALSGSIDGGFSNGLHVLAGPSKHFKSNLMLVMVSAYLEKYPEAVCLFYDSEFGAKSSYFASFGIDPAKVIHTPITNIEELKFDLMAQLENITSEDKLIVIIDSIGNLASKKEVEDAKDQKSVADMTRAKAIKSLFRMVTPFLTTKDIPLIAVNHTYDTQEMFSKTVVSGGTGIYYSANTVFIIGRSQEKDGDELAGYKFTINVDKSRTVKEKSKLPFVVNFDSGISRFSGLLDIALETGHVVKPKNGWYTRPCVADDKSWRAKDALDKEFWLPLFKSDFPLAVEKRYKLGISEMLSEEAKQSGESDAE